MQIEKGWPAKTVLSKVLTHHFSVFVAVRTVIIVVVKHRAVRIFGGSVGCRNLNVGPKPTLDREEGILDADLSSVLQSFDAGRVRKVFAKRPEKSI